MQSLQEKETQLEAVSQERKKLKMHKKVFKEEIKRLRAEVSTLDQKNSSRAAALKSLADFFNNQTMQKVREFKN